MAESLLRRLQPPPAWSAIVGLLAVGPLWLGLKGLDEIFYRPLFAGAESALIAALGDIGRLTDMMILISVALILTTFSVTTAHKDLERDRVKLLAVAASVGLSWGLIVLGIIDHLPIRVPGFVLVHSAAGVCVGAFLAASTISIIASRHKCWRFVPAVSSVPLWFIGLLSSRLFSLDSPYAFWILGSVCLIAAPVWAASGVSNVLWLAASLWIKWQPPEHGARD